MKKAILPLLALSFCAVHADEGMWRPRQIPELRERLTSMGMRIDPARLGDLLDYPMDAVVSLGGCTASFVSPDGLVITNHHCAYGSIQYNSTEERNLIEAGFLATSRAEELPGAPGSRVYVTVAATDVTSRVLDGLPVSLGGRERYQAIDDREKALVAECETDEGHRCRVASYNGGLEYELIKQLEIRDVRLVHAPGRSIGDYGGDVDNWMWPRHTGDYSFLRAWVGPDGKPADYAPGNVPYHPKHWLKVAAGGVADGSLVFAAGYPGRTSRYRLASEVENTFGWSYPTRTRLYRQWLDIIDHETADRPDAAIKYASIVSRLNNSMKNNEGMLNGYARSDMLERKRRTEGDLQRWIEADAGRRARYGSAIQDLRDLVAKDQAMREQDMYYQSLIGRTSILSAARTLYRLSVERTKPDIQREAGYQGRDLPRIRERLTRMDRSFTPEVDRAVLRRFILDYAVIPADQHVGAFDTWFGIDGNRVDEAKLDARLEEMYSGTRLTDLKTRLSLMDADRSALDTSDDPFVRLAAHLFESDMRIEEREKTLEGEFQAARPRLMEAMIAWRAGRGEPLYPDANGTLRITYGTVKGYTPRDAVDYEPFTTADGIVEKNTGEDPFDPPASEVAAIRAKRFGPYAAAGLGTLPVDFLTTLDSTGGNSGSPTLDANGELAGLLFDGNWESIIADWDFIPSITRSIHVDIRYVLWVMDEIAGAHDLIREMGVTPASTATTAADGGL